MQIGACDNNKHRKKKAGDSLGVSRAMKVKNT